MKGTSLLEQIHRHVWTMCGNVPIPHSYVQGRRNRGGGGGGAVGALAPPPPNFFPNTPKVPLFLSKKCPFKVNHAPFLLRKRAFSSIFKSLNANFCPWRGTVIIEKAQSGQRGTLWYLYCHILGPYGDGGTGKLSLWTFLIAPEGAQSRAVEAGGRGRLHSQNFQHPQSALFSK